MSDYGILFHESDIKLHRKYFAEMVKLWGVQAIYYAPKSTLHYTTYGEIDSNYYEPQKIGVLFNEHPDQKTMKLMGWDYQQDTQVALITVPYDTPHIQVGALFMFPAAVDGGEPRMFRVSKMKTSMIYPSGVTCECVPEYKDNFDKADFSFKNSGVNLLNREEDNI